LPDLSAIKAVVFDMDGLLFDTETLFFEAMRSVGDEQGHPITHAFFLTLVGLNTERNHALMRGHFGPDFPAVQFHDACRERFFELLETDLRLKPGVIELLDQIDQLGLPKAIVTSSQRNNVEHHLEAFDITDRFDAIFAYGDYPHSKPHPAPYLAATAALGFDPRHCLALEDSHNGVRSAAAAGMVTIMVPDLLPPDAEMRSLTYHIAVDLHEVRALFTA
jgi:HAD superfamily hydrolase (TIGR01509 family)